MAAGEKTREKGKTNQVADGRRKGKPFQVRTDGQDTSGKRTGNARSSEESPEEISEALWGYVVKGISELTPEKIRDDEEIRDILRDVIENSSNPEAVAVAKRKLGLE